MATPSSTDACPTVGPVTSTRYDEIGAGYAAVRREDPVLRNVIHRALGDSQSVVNVGAGGGSYEPDDRYVIAVEPSDVMSAQRPPEKVPALRGNAAPLMLRTDSVDAAMAVMTIHHWDHQLEEGIHELRRVARGPVVIVTVDTTVSGQMWLLQDYLTELADLDRGTFPPIDQLVEWLGGTVDVESVPISRDTPDWSLLSYWAHPERVLDGTARRATSGFSRMEPAIIQRVVGDVARDLADGIWDRRYGHLRALDTLDVGMRLVVARP